MEGLPPYAGIVTSASARAEGLSVADATTILHRIAYVKQRLAIAAAMFLPSTPEWEAKGALALHGWLDAEHAATIYARIAEMREPPPGPWDIPDPALESALDEVLAAPTTAARLGALYTAVRPAVRTAMAAYLALTNDLCDQPSSRLLRLIAFEEADTIDRWTAELAFDDDALAWGDHVRQCLASAGGLVGLEERPPAPPKRFQRPYAPDVLPRRGAGGPGIYDTSTPADIVYLDESRGADERNAALMFKRLREMDVPEVIAGIVAERWAAERNAGTRTLPWTYYAGMLRQMWDEARHAMLGQALMESRGIDWTALPVNVTFSWKLARYCSPLERHVLLYAIEQSLMPRDRGKPYEYRVASDSGDRLSMLFHDYDWADEVLHVDIARRCLKPELAGGLAEARRQADALWERIAEALTRDPMPLDGDPDRVTNWWPRFAREVLGRDVAAVPETHLKDWRPLD
jgi:hypothetical protein